jgi:hypothetical protein
MSTPQSHISISVGGSNPGQIAAGDNNTQIQGSVTENDLAEVRQLLQAVKEQVTTEADPAKRAEALGEVEALEKALTGAKPDVGRARQVLDWFRRNLPKLVGSVVGLVVHPVVGKVVEAAGEMAAGEFKRQVGVDG